VASKDELKEIRGLLDQIRAQYRKLGKESPLDPFDESKITDVQKEVRHLKDLLKGVTQQVEELNTRVSQAAFNFKEIVQQIKKSSEGLNLATKSFNSLASISQKVKNDQNGIVKLTEKELTSLKDKLKQERENLKLSQSLLRAKKKNQGLSDEEKIALKEINEQLDRSSNSFKDLNQQLDARILKEEKILEVMGLGGAAVAGVQTALNKMGFGALGRALGLDEVKEKMRETAEYLVDSGKKTDVFSNKFKVLKAGISEAGKQLKQSLTDPAAVTSFLVTEIISAIQGVDKATGELAKSFGISYDQAGGIRNELNTIANFSGDINVNTSRLQESLIAINKEFGTATMFSGEILTDFTQLTKVAGYSTEAAAKLSKITTATGGDLSDNTAQILGQATAFNVVNGLALNEKEIVEDVSKASSAITLSMGMSVGELTKAVAQAKSFGLELAKVEQIQNSLLQFESSIEAELEAELLLGKNINLEKARQAALNNDLATVAEEIAKQAGSAAEFTKMNVIQQEALAKAVGMNREDLAKSLIEREALAAAGMKEGSAIDAYNKLKRQGLSDDEIATKLGDKKLADQLKSQSIQERFNVTIEKLREIFVSLAEPLMPVLDVFAGILKVVGPIAGFMGQIVKYTVELSKILLPVYALYKGIMFFKQKGATQAAVANVLNKAGLLTDKQKLFYESRMTYFANQKLGLNNKNLILEKSRVLNSLKKSVLEKANLAIEKLGLSTLVKKVAMSKTIKAIKNSSLLKTIAEAAMSAYASVAKIPFIGPALGIAAAASAAALGYKYMKGDDVVSPGYGKRTLMAPEGSIALNDKDTVIAGTDLGGGKDNVSAAPSIDLSPLIERMSAVENVLVQILNKNVDVYLDSDKVGTSFNVNTVSVQ